jgi:transposase
VLSFPASIRLFVARHPVDFRKAHDGLVAIIRDHFGDDPFDGSVFVFLNRQRDRVKIIHWDRDGLWLHYKRLEQGRFHIELDGDGERVEVSRPELSMLLDGIDWKKRKIRKPFDAARRSAHRGRRGDDRELRASR